MTPLDLVNAINHGNGLKSTIAELFYVNMDHPDMKVWQTEQRKKAKEYTLEILGRCNIIEYRKATNCSDGYIAKCRAYRYSKVVNWQFQRYSSHIVAGHVECVDGEEEDGEENSTDREVADTAGAGISQVTEAESHYSIYQLHKGTVMFQGTETEVRIILIPLW